LCYLWNTIMSAIIIKADAKSNKLLRELAKRLGADVLKMNDEQYEDFVLGTIMDKEKTGTEVSREEVFKKLQQK
jgi:hypothetical protein